MTTVSLHPLRDSRVALRVRGGGQVFSKHFPSERDARVAVRDCRELIEHFTVDGDPVIGLLEAALPRWAYPLIPGWSAA
ncbi:hypothetical protein [Mycobacteroides abscessus]|uniref:hypothetical protein n=1 Tax=Mycobacteroides abscessus TaxID=36809 RepID=UPI0005E04808|nr:hypothetical protein [Mycobacteroides abscessus]CPW94750.1 Uncharacterised protein [Mycobacteroides abscessus]